MIAVTLTINVRNENNKIGEQSFAIQIPENSRIDPYDIDIASIYANHFTNIFLDALDKFHAQDEQLL